MRAGPQTGPPVHFWPDGGTVGGSDRRVDRKASGNPPTVGRRPHQEPLEWERVDSNHRRLSRQIYSLLPADAQPLSDNELQSASTESAAQTTARDPENDPDLAQVIASWPTLLEPVKAGIVAMVKAVKEQTPTVPD